MYRLAPSIYAELFSFFSIVANYPISRPIPAEIARVLGKRGSGGASATSFPLSKAGVFQDRKEGSLFEWTSAKRNHDGHILLNEDAVASPLPDERKSIRREQFLNLRRIHLLR